MTPHAEDPLADVYVKIGNAAYEARAANTLKVGAATVEGVITAARQAGSVTVSTNEVVPVGVKARPESVIRFTWTV